MDLDVKKFFEEISRGEKVNFEYLHEQGGIKSGEGKQIGGFPYQSRKMKYYTYKAIEEFSTYSKDGYGIYFVVNGGGYREGEINDIRSCFADLDIKDEIEYELQSNGFSGTLQELEEQVNHLFSNLSKERHRQYKQLFMNRIEELSELGIVPSSIIETKNGFHVYFFVQQGTTLEQFAHAENLLIYCLNADKVVKNPNRVLRVPGTRHLKNPNDPFEVKLIMSNPDKRYDISELINNLSSLREQNTKYLFQNKDKEGIQKTRKIEKKSGLPARKGIDYSNYQDGNIALIAKGFEGLDELKQKLGLHSEVSTRYIDRNEIRQFLKKQDLTELLGLGNRFYCIFHNGTNPTSGTVYQNEEGNYYYKCHSSKCGKWYDIHNVIQRITSLNIVDSFEYLKCLYNIQEVKTEWQIRQEQLIEFNLELIERFKYDLELQTQYKNLFKFLSTKGTIGIFKRIHNIAKNKLPQFAKTMIQHEKDTNQVQNAVVFAPIAKIIEDIIIEEGISKLDINTTKTKAAILIFMYLLNVIGFEELPDEMKDKITTYRKNESRHNELSHYKNNPRFYEIVSLDTDRLDLAEEMAQFYFDNELTINNFRRETIFRLCGEEEANRVFPDRKEEGFSKLHDSMAVELDRLLVQLIEEKGWTNDHEIIEKLVIPDFNKQQAFKNTFKYLKDKPSEAIDSIHINDDDPNMLKWYQNFVIDRLRINFPYIRKEHDLTKVKINAYWRKKFNINIDVKGSIYIREESVCNDSIPDDNIHIDKHNLILSLNEENKSINEITSIAKCSRRYVYKVLQVHSKSSKSEIVKV